MKLKFWKKRTVSPLMAALPHGKGPCPACETWSLREVERPGQPNKVVCVHTGCREYGLGKA